MYNYEMTPAIMFIVMINCSPLYNQQALYAIIMLRNKTQYCQGVLFNKVQLSVFDMNIYCSDRGESAFLKINK